MPRCEKKRASQIDVVGGDNDILETILQMSFAWKNETTMSEIEEKQKYEKTIKNFEQVSIGQIPQLFSQNFLQRTMIMFAFLKASEDF